MGEAALLAGAQETWGVFVRAEALQHVSPGLVISRLRSGRWLRLYPGVYVAAGAPESWERRVYAAVRRMPPSRACASHLTAAALWGWTNRPEKIDLTVGFFDNHVEESGLIVHRSRHLPGHDVVRRSGIPTTSAPRTIVDVAGVFRRNPLGAIVDTALLRRNVSIATLHRYIETRRQLTRPGVKVLLTLLSDRTIGVPESELERRFLRLITRAGLPRPARQFSIGRRRVDFAYPDARLAIELDGVAFHGSVAAIAADRRRQNQVILAGWTLLRFGWEDVVAKPEPVVSSVKALLTGGRGS